jgi:hypothetical protein
MTERVRILELFAEAQRLVADSERHLFEQRERLAKLERDGHDTGEARRRLTEIEERLKHHAEDLEGARRALAALPEAGAPPDRTVDPTP